ncbi:hypothetical protein OAS39_12155 [Pirellulales bacterium]|nr:hypothetical protein [Pirellulales bacterium]
MSLTQRTAANACLALGLVVAGSAEARAQTPYAAGAHHQSSVSTGMNNPASRYFGGVPNVAPVHRSAVIAQPILPTPRQHALKPFHGVTPSPTVTPYLALGLAGTDALSNYYSIVRPQIQQQQQLEMQNAQMIKLQQQLRANGTVVPRGGMPTTGSTSGRFQNYGGYYPSR